MADCGKKDFQDAIDDAFQAQQEYHLSTTAASRGTILRKWFDLITYNKADCKFPHVKPNRVVQPANTLCGSGQDSLP